jgi:ribosomal-protein-alanine N-acetyltransferase
MSAILRDERWLQPMPVQGLAAVLAVEEAAYEFPWTRGNFIDSMVAGHWAQVLVGPSTQLLGYLVAMHGVDEMHLLNLTVAPEHQHCGHARYMLDALVDHCEAQHAARLWLEVRESNRRGRAIYERYGFRTLGWRSGYYPAPRKQREDAVVMSLRVPKDSDALE